MIEFGNDSDIEVGAWRQVERNVAAIVDVSLLKAAAFEHCHQNLVGHRAGYRRHRRDKIARMRQTRIEHASCHRAGDAGMARIDRTPQRRQIVDELVENGTEPVPSL